MHLFSNDIQASMSQLSKSFRASCYRPKRMNPLLDILDYNDAQRLHAFLEGASGSQHMQQIAVSNISICQIIVSARYDYVRASIHLASWKSCINFESIMVNNTVYCNISSDYMRIEPTLRLIGGLVAMICKNVKMYQDVSTIILVLGTSMPMLYIHKMRIAHASEILLQFLRRHRPNVSFQLMNCLP